MKVSKNITRGIIDLCELLYNEDTDNCTLTLDVPNSDMELEIEVSYQFNRIVKSKDVED